MSENLIEVKNLCKYFPAGKNRTLKAVDNVSLAIRKGETLGLVGESGCGKTTCGRTILKLYNQTAGQIFYNGEEISHLKGKDLLKFKKNAQMIFQDPYSSLDPRMTIGEIISEGMSVHSNLSAEEKNKRVTELLARVGLTDDYANRFAHELSGGQRQRIGIARALASGPKLLLGDEPVSALDVSVQAQVVNLLESLKHQLGLTMVIVAHGLAVIRHMSDRVAVMYLGQIVELATVDEIFDAPLHPYTQALIASAPQMQPGIERDAPLLQGDLPNPASPPSGCRFHTRCPYVTDECRQVEPINQVLDGGRQVACHRWQDINRDRSVIQIAPPSAAFLRRRALFEHAATHSSLPSRNS